MTTACGDTLSHLWTDFGLEEEYKHYRFLHPQITVDNVDRARSAEEKMALKVDLREAIGPLMATIGMQPDLECSECSSHCCPNCITKWKRMESSEERKEEQGRETREEKEEEVVEKERRRRESKGERCYVPLCLSWMRAVDRRR